jgi:hypothetical protein
MLGTGLKYLTLKNNGWSARPHVILEFRVFYSLVLYLCSRGYETVLGETADPVELFVIDQCEDFDPSAIVGKATVIQKVIPNNWAELGGLEVSISHGHDIVDDGKTFFFQHM